MNRWKRIAGGVVLCGWVALAPVAAQQVVLTPAQTAMLKREQVKAEDQYVSQVAKIAGVRQRTVRQAIPDHARITDPVARVISALEHTLGEPLSDEQKDAIRAADAEYTAAIKAAEETVMKR
ncbi:hypothetical protein [Uliginosibacterium gangwonense]|uniref:hypothetical protein n=1 Tax=Uliginosibacterium gangwonense TaxID=392736 RepID=UPI0003685783|nr:hypothetical protein [Uliginosibacterium gangwonense]